MTAHYSAVTLSITFILNDNMHLKYEENSIIFRDNCAFLCVCPGLSLSYRTQALLTNEPCIGGQAGLVIVLVGTGAHCGWSHPAVHLVVSQP